MKRLFLFLFLASFFLACEQANNQSTSSDSMHTKTVSNYLSELNMTTDTLEVATFSGGHFYGLEAVFQQLRGTEHILSGYTGGRKKGPGFEEVNSGNSKHRMAVQVYYDPNKISYQMLLAVYFAAHNPTNKETQGIESGPQFRPVIFYHNDQQKEQAREELEKNKKKRKYKGKTIYTAIQPYKEFWVAEPEHQDYAFNNKEEDYIQNVIRPYLRSVEKKYGAWMLRGKAVFPVTQNPPPQPPNQ